jgi:branched-chain amino acid transport system ATP-binding protein
MTTVLEVRDLRVIFGGVTAVDGVSFSVADGQLLGLIGPNGAGKTTVMRSITGIVRPTGGDILLDGQRVTGLPIHRRMRRGLALSQQLVRPFREMSVIENVAFAAGYRKTGNPLKSLVTFDWTPEQARATELLAMVEISSYADADTGSVPLGVLKRLEVARALALDPKVLLLDEPLAGLNSNEAVTLADTIKRLNDDGLTVVLIEHNLGEVMRICPRLVVLDNGRKIGDGPAQEVMADPDVRAAYLGTGAGDSHAAA